MASVVPDLSEDHPVDFLKITVGLGKGERCAAVLRKSGDGLYLYGLDTSRILLRETSLERCNAEHVFVRIDPPLHLDRLLILFREVEIAKRFFTACACRVKIKCSFTAFEVLRGLTSVRKYKHRKTRYEDVDALYLSGDGAFFVAQGPEVHFTGFGVASAVDLSTPIETCTELSGRLKFPLKRPTNAVMILEEFSWRVVSDEPYDVKTHILRLSELLSAQKTREDLALPKIKPRCTHTERALTFLNQINKLGSRPNENRVQRHIANLQEALEQQGDLKEYAEINEKRESVLLELQALYDVCSPGSDGD